jgi:hypothetical protein
MAGSPQKDWTPEAESEEPKRMPGANLKLGGLLGAGQESLSTAIIVRRTAIPMFAMIVV